MTSVEVEAVRKFCHRIAPLQPLAPEEKSPGGSWVRRGFSISRFMLCVHGWRGRVMRVCVPGGKPVDEVIRRPRPRELHLAILHDLARA
jgi:hypothetical protein